MKSAQGVNNRPHNNLIELLQGTELFYDLPENFLKRIFPYIYKRFLENKQILFLQQDHADFFAIISNGVIHTLLYNGEGREIIVGDHGPGACIGGEVLIGHEHRFYAAEAFGNTHLLIFPKYIFSELMSEPVFLERLLKLNSQRLHEMIRLIETTCLYSLEARLARVILEKLENLKTINHTLRNQFTVNQSKLAAMINVSRPKLNATLQEWKRHGVIQIKSGSLKVIDINWIQRKANNGSKSVNRKEIS